MADERAARLDLHFTVKDEASEYRWSVARGMLRLFEQRTSRDDIYWLGEFLDPRGIVTIMREASHTRLDMVHDGYAYSRTWRKFFGDRTVAKLARAFITDVQAATPKEDNPDGN